MPRTKQRKAKRNSTGCEQIVRDFNRLVQLKIQKVELEFKGMAEKFETSMQVTLSRYPAEIQNMTLRELFTPDESPKKENHPPKTPRHKDSKNTSAKLQNSVKPKRVTAASDDGYQSESQTSQASKMTKEIKRRSKSVSQEAKVRMRSLSRDRKSKLTQSSVPNKAQLNKDLLKTPNCKTSNSFVITPKIKLNSAINVLRKPKDGEMVFSTQGSPLLVSTTVNDKTANINVPLKNGQVISLLPFHETSLTENVHLDDETRHQLKILQSHLAKVLH